MFTPDANVNGADYASFTFQVEDSASAFDATAKTLTVDVTPVNDAPVGTDHTVTTSEDTPYTFAASDFGFTDVDLGDVLQGVRIVAGPAAGELTLDGNAVTAGQVIAAADIGNLVFTPDANANGAGYASFTFQVEDSASAFDATAKTLTVDVTPVNDAPVGTDHTVTTSEDTPYTFAASDFGFTDVDLGDVLQGVRIVAGPAAGELTLDGNAVTAGQVIAAADIGNLVFTPDANANGAGHASFTFQVEDSASAFDATAIKLFKPRSIFNSKTLLLVIPTLCVIDEFKVFI